MSRLGADESPDFVLFRYHFRGIRTLDLAVVSFAGEDPDYHKKGISCQAFSGTEKPLYRVMRSSLRVAHYSSLPIATHQGIVMQSPGFPRSLSPCVRIFLEILCDEAFALASVESRLLAPFEQTVAQQEQPNLAAEAK